METEISTQAVGLASSADFSLMNLFLKFILGTIIMFAALQTSAKISGEEFYNIKFNSIDAIRV